MRSPPLLLVRRMRHSHAVHAMHHRCHVCREMMTMNEMKTNDTIKKTKDTMDDARECVPRAYSAHALRRTRKHDAREHEPGPSSLGPPAPGESPV